MVIISYTNKSQVLLHRLNYFSYIIFLMVMCLSALMQSIREDIEQDHELIQSSDVVTFFYVAQFVMAFQYNKCFTSKVRWT